MSKHCSLCGTEIKEGERACSFCGTAAPDTPETPAAPPMTFLPGKTVKKHVCSGCGKEYPNGGKFCPECGGKIDETTLREEIPVKISEVRKFVCSGCGKEYPNGGKFCPECGGMIEEKVTREEVSGPVGDEIGMAAEEKAPSGEPAKTAGRGDTYDDWCSIGHLYQKGRCGFPLDMAKALEAYRKAASLNECRNGKYRENGYAECCLGYFYQSGNCVPKDAAAARKWFEISHACGNEFAERELTRLGYLKRPDPPKRPDSPKSPIPPWLPPVAIILGVIIFVILVVVLTDDLTWRRLNFIWQRL